MDLLALLLVLLPLAARCVSMDGASVVGDDLVGHGQQRKQQYSLPPPLLLTPLLEAGNATEARRLATVPPLLPSCCVSFSGFLTVDKQHDSNLFFWFFRPETRRGDAPLVVWLQGGPGTSMARTVFLENGPYQIDPRTMQLKRRRGSWTHEHSVLYFDNPVGTGFSFTGSPDGLATNCTQISWSLAEALRQFFIMFPGQRRRDLYIAGESFGGKMAVSLAHHLLFDKLNSFNLKGVLVVNGLVDAASQLDKSELAYQLGLVDEAGRDEMHAVAEEQARLMREGHWDQARELGVDECGSSVSPDVTGMAALSNLLLWNGTQDDGYHDFVQHLHIRRALHVGNATFSGRARAVAYALRDDVGQPVLAELGRVADRVRVLVASGQLDICLPYRLTANFLRKMVWQGAGEWDTARRVTWCVRGSLAGYARTSRGLTHVLVRNAGHYLGQDQPRWAADMLGRFTGQLSFDTCEERCDVRILT